MSLYNDKTHKILSLLYSLRVLSLEQIYKYIFESENLSERYCNNIVRKLVAEKYISKEGYKTDQCYYNIENNGYLFLKEYGILGVCKSTWNEPDFPEDFLQPCKIKLKEKNVAHQLALNDFVLKFGLLVKNEYFEYYDEKYAGQIIDFIRPDGILKYNNTLFFLEMDMNTENKRQLDTKWNNYRKFLNSSAYNGFNYSIRVLFILGGIKGRSKRGQLIQKYVDINLQTFISYRFNVYAARKDELLNYMSKVDMCSGLFGKYNYSMQFNISDDALNNFSFIGHIACKDVAGNVIKKGNAYMEFVIDKYFCHNMYVFEKIKYIHSINASFKRKYNTSLKYLILIDSVDEAYTLLKMTGVFTDNIYFTTPDRLANSKTFEQSLFSVTQQGTVYHYSDEDLRVKIPEYDLSIM